MHAVHVERTRNPLLHLRTPTEIAGPLPVPHQAGHARAQRAVGLYSGGMRTLARQNLDVVQQTFDLGRATVFDVLAEQRRYLEVEQAYTTALREAWEARAALNRALGEMK